VNRNDRDPDEFLTVDLTSDERHMLSRAVTQFDGSARCSEETAKAFGFESVNDLRVQGLQLAESLEASEPLSKWDWTRSLFVCEVVFASDVMGSGHDWHSATGLSDFETIGLLRSVQTKLLRHLVPIGQMVYGLDGR
jgi:hypothetical protein